MDDVESEALILNPLVLLIHINKTCIYEIAMKISVTNIGCFFCSVEEASGGPNVNYNAISTCNDFINTSVHTLI